MGGLQLAPKPEYRQNHFTEFRASAQYQQSMIEWVEGIEGSEAGLQAQITDNADNIATNTTNIGQNASNIATNTDNIESNTNARTEYNAKFDSILAGDYWDGASVVTTGNWQFGDIQSTGGIFGDPGFESGGIDIGGTIFNSTLKVSDIGGTNPAQTILHRHSTTLPPAIIGARSHSNTSTHAIVVDGDNLLDIFAVGWDGNNYKIAASIRMEVDGVPGSNDMPGRIVLSTTADGGITLTDAVVVDSDQLVKLTNDLEVTEGGTGASDAADARTNLDVDVAGTDNSTNVSLAGTPNYITIVGQVITRALINLTSHITGILPLANGGTNDAAVTSANIGHLKAMDQDLGTGDSPAWVSPTYTGGLIGTSSTSISLGATGTSGKNRIDATATEMRFIAASNAGLINILLDRTLIYPSTDNRMDLGRAANRFKNVIVSENIKSGAAVTGSRPTPQGAGSMFFDTTLGIPIWHDGTNWIDAAGTTV